MADPTASRLDLLCSGTERPMTGRSELSFFLQMEEDINSEFLSPPPIQQPNDPGIMEQWQNPKLPWKPTYLCSPTDQILDHCTIVANP